MTETSKHYYNKSIAINERCNGCKYCRQITATGNWSFKGCTHTPYKGKLISEIEKCPKGASE